MGLAMRGDAGKRVELEQYVSTLLGACVDYRNLLIRANVPDSVSGRHEGVEAIMRRFDIQLTLGRSRFGEKPQIEATIGREED